MNRIYRLVWNATLGAPQVAAETARAGRKGPGGSALQHHTPKRASARGRPASPIPRHARNAEAARRYRARKKMEREARRDPRQPIRSAIIDLSAVAVWKR